LMSSALQISTRIVDAKIGFTASPFLLNGVTLSPRPYLSQFWVN